MFEPRPEAIEALQELASRQVLDGDGGPDWHTRHDWSTGAERAIAFDAVINDHRTFMVRYRAHVDQSDAQLASWPWWRRQYGVPEFDERRFLADHGIVTP